MSVKITFTCESCGHTVDVVPDGAGNADIQQQLVNKGDSFTICDIKIDVDDYDPDFILTTLNSLQVRCMTCSNVFMNVNGFGQFS